MIKISMPVPPPEGSKKVFEGLNMSAYQWPQKLFDGGTKTFECVVRPDTVTVIPFLDRNTVLMTKQRHVEKPEPFWDVPGGRVDPGETFEQTVIRELQEETGYRAGRLAQWMDRKHEGLVLFEQAVYIAIDLTRDPEGDHQENSEHIELVPMAWDDLVRMCLQKSLRQSEVMLSILGIHYDPEQRAKLDAFLSGR